MPTSIRWPGSSPRWIRQSATRPTWPTCRSRSAGDRAATTSTIQALEPYLPTEKINLSFSEGLLFRRIELLIDRQALAVSLFNGPTTSPQLGFRRIIDTTFMMATMIHRDADPEDLRNFFRASRRAQRDLDLRPDRYTQYYKNEFPERFHPVIDTRRCGPGERLVFEPYTKEAHAETFDWITRHGIFAEGGTGNGRYEDS